MLVIKPRGVDGYTERHQLQLSVLVRFSRVCIRCQLVHFNCSSYSQRGEHLQVER